MTKPLTALTDPDNIAVVWDDEPDTDEHGPLDEQSAALLVAMHRHEDAQAANNSPRRPSAKFDPEQPRDPHSGHWIALGAEVAHEVHKLGGGDLHVTAHPDHPGRVTLTHGDHSVHLSEREQHQLTRHLHSDDSDEEFGSRVETNGGQPHEVPLYRVTHGGHDTEGAPTAHTFTLAHPGEDFHQLGDRPGLSMTHAQARQLDDSVRRASAARRLETGYGPLDVFTPGADRIGFRMKDPAGKPTTVEFGAQDWDRVDHANNLLLDGFDEGYEPDPKLQERLEDEYDAIDNRRNEANGYSLSDKDQARLGELSDQLTALEHPPELNHLTVQTSHGPVDLDWHGPRADDGYPPGSSLTITPHQGDWSIAIDGDHMSDVFNAESHVEAAAGLDQRDPVDAKAKKKWLTIRPGSDT